ncbi:ABC-ATPase domain-containing protein [Bacillaceae bacterium W0354]
MKELKKLLQQMDSKSYGLYKKLKGSYHFSAYDLFVDYVQGDPFASPSKIRIVIPKNSVEVKREWIKTERRKIYVEDYMLRATHHAIRDEGKIVRGSGKSGLIYIDEPVQEILQRSAISISENKIIICMSIGLPANGRRINGSEAEKLFFQAIPTILERSMFSLNMNEVKQAIELADQHDAIREKMKEEGWVAFIANDSILPRQSGVSNKPLKDAVPFKSPKENEVSFKIPHRNSLITGMAIKKGITLIIGGGFHGKSTLLEALELGVYDHVLGDGREYVFTDPNAVKIRAEDGRSVTKVDISSFISELPTGIKTSQFSTSNASGSTSQATNVVEALEAGASTLLIDEDTSATNFMIRDEVMQKLVRKEPITPFVQRINQLTQQLDLSVVIVMGGSSDYIGLAEDVILMDEYVPVNITNHAKQMIDKKEREIHDTIDFDQRVINSKSIKQILGRKEKAQAKGLKQIMLGKDIVDLTYIEQLVDVSQTTMIANMLKYIALHDGENRTLVEWLNIIEKNLGKFLNSEVNHPGNLARPRRFEIAQALNRIRGLRIE